MMKMRIVGEWIIGLRSSIRVNRRKDDEWSGGRDEWCRNSNRRKRDLEWEERRCYFVSDEILSAESFSSSQEARNELILIWVAVTLEHSDGWIGQLNIL
jgi:hypothetical protein